MGEKIRVGIFDSGVGGLTVLRCCRKIFPAADYIYYGDNGNAPYGERSEADIRRLVQGGVGELAEHAPDAVVLACNTATAVCAEELRAKFPFPVVGMEPAVKPAARACRRILLLATERTAQSRRLGALLARFPANAFTVCGTRLAGAVEAWLRGGEPVSLREHLPVGDFDGVVLGCTHYVFLKREIGAFYGAPVFDGNEGTARRVFSLFARRPVDAEWTENTKTNKSSICKWSADGVGSVIFLGEWAEFNGKIYEQKFENGIFDGKTAPKGP